MKSFHPYKHDLEVSYAQRIEEVSLSSKDEFLLFYHDSCSIFDMEHSVTCEFCQPKWRGKQGACFSLSRHACFIVPHTDTSHFLAMVVCARFNLKGQTKRGGQAVTETRHVRTLCLITHKFTAACQKEGRELVPWKGQALCSGFT